MSDHDHPDLWAYIGGLREDLGRAEARIREVEDRVGALEKDTPQARQAQLEADQAAADLAESGYDRHGRGCRCSYCDYDDEPEESPLARRDAYIGTWSNQDVTRRQP